MNAQGAGRLATTYRLTHHQSLADLPADSPDLQEHQPSPADATDELYAAIDDWLDVDLPGADVAAHTRTALKNAAREAVCGSFLLLDHGVMTADQVGGLPASVWRGMAALANAHGCPLDSVCLPPGLSSIPHGLEFLGPVGYVELHEYRGRDIDLRCLQVSNRVLHLSLKGTRQAVVVHAPVELSIQATGHEGKVRLLYYSERNFDGDADVTAQKAAGECPVSPQAPVLPNSSVMPACESDPLTESLFHGLSTISDDHKILHLAGLNSATVARLAEALFVCDKKLLVPGLSIILHSTMPDKFKVRALDIIWRRTKKLLDAAKNTSAYPACFPFFFRSLLDSNISDQLLFLLCQEEKETGIPGLGTALSQGDEQNVCSLINIFLRTDGLAYQVISALKFPAEEHPLAIAIRRGFRGAVSVFVEAVLAADWLNDQKCAVLDCRPDGDQFFLGAYSKEVGNGVLETRFDFMSRVLRSTFSSDQKAALLGLTISAFPEQGKNENKFYRRHTSIFFAFVEAVLGSDSTAREKAQLLHSAAACKDRWAQPFFDAACFGKLGVIKTYVLTVCNASLARELKIKLLSRGALSEMLLERNPIVWADYENGLKALIREILFSTLDEHGQVEVLGTIASNWTPARWEKNASSLLTPCSDTVYWDRIKPGMDLFLEDGLSDRQQALLLRLHFVLHNMARRLHGCGKEDVAQVMQRILANAMLEKEKKFELFKDLLRGAQLADTSIQAMRFLLNSSLTDEAKVLTLTDSFSSGLGLDGQCIDLVLESTLGEALKIQLIKNFKGPQPGSYLKIFEAVANSQLSSDSQFKIFSGLMNNATGSDQSRLKNLSVVLACGLSADQKYRLLQPYVRAHLQNTLNSSDLGLYLKRILTCPLTEQHKVDLCMAMGNHDQGYFSVLLYNAEHRITEAEAAKDRACVYAYMDTILRSSLPESGKCALLTASGLSGQSGFQNPLRFGDSAVVSLYKKIIAQSNLLPESKKALLEKSQCVIQ